MYRLIPIIVIIGLLLSACNSDESSAPTITVFAASSLSDAYDELATSYESKHDIEIRLNYAGSSQLALQLTQGATADIFASANQMQIQRLLDADITSNQAQVFANNNLVMITSTQSEVNISTFADIFYQDVTLVTTIEAVPIRDYTDQFLQAVQASDDVPSDVQSQYMDKVVSEEGNVRQVVLKVALNEADAAIVYRSDVTVDIQADVNIISLPEAYLPQPEYFILNLSDNGDAQGFIDFIFSDEGQAILEKWGLIPVN